MLTYVGTAFNVLMQGDDWSLTFNDDQHDNVYWTASIAISRQGDILFQKAGVPSNGDFLFTLSPAESLTITPGKVDIYIVFAQTTTARYSAYAGSCVIIPNSLGTFPDTPTMQALTAVLATITKVLGQPEASASFNGESYTMQNITALYDIRNRLVSDVNAELRAYGLTTRGAARTILTRFR